MSTQPTQRTLKYVHKQGDHCNESVQLASLVVTCVCITCLKICNSCATEVCASMSLGSCKFLFTRREGLSARCWCSGWPKATNAVIDFDTTFSVSADVFLVRTVSGSHLHVCTYVPATEIDNCMIVETLGIYY